MQFKNLQKIWILNDHSCIIFVASRPRNNKDEQGKSDLLLYTNVVDTFNQTGQLLSPDCRVPLELFDVRDGQAENEVHENDGHVEHEHYKHDPSHPEIRKKNLRPTIRL